MKNHVFRRILSLLLVAALLAGFYVPGAQAATTKLTWKETDREVTPHVMDREAETHVEEPYQPSDIVRVSIILEEKSTLQAGYSTKNIARNSDAAAYSSNLKAKQDALAKTISTQALDGRKLDVVWNLTLVGNIISAKVPYGKIDAIAAVDGVRDVILENRYLPCVVEREEVAEPQMYASLAMTGSSLLWSSGYTGAGSRVAIIDTGTDTNHQSLDSGAFLYALEQNAKAAGLSYEEYVAGLDLLDAQEIASVLSKLNIYESHDSLTAAQLYLSEKLPFAVNYVDSDPLVVDHESDEQSEHGSHVAGITAANRYIPTADGYADALETVLMAGTAPDAQIITLKVFGYSGGPADSDYMAAIEDAIYLGCDAVNLSLGSSVAGASFNSHYADLLEYMTTTDTVVVASAGNAGSWADASTFGYLYNDDVNFDTVGAPGSYANLFTVASVENDGGVGMLFKAAGYNSMYVDGLNGANYPLSYLDTTGELTGTEYDFVFVDGLGYAEDYTGIDLSGKVVFCSRGTTNFTVKAETAVSLGAVATIIYNNQSGGSFNMDLSAYSRTEPAASISQADANAIRAAATQQTTADGLTYYTGKITVYGRMSGYVSSSEYYTMSDFSSWGVPGDLSIKPEITAPGGNIYSLAGENYFDGSYYGGPDQYELMSGTSMAAPAVTGMAALMAQYLRESGLAEQEGMNIRTLAQSLLMSTAVPMIEADSGSYYSIMKQGAGLGRVDLATNADSYILVSGQDDGKVKAELGDDPNRTGVYEFSFSINNLTGEEKSFALSADIFRQDFFEYQQGAGFYMLDYWTADLPASATFTANGVQISQAADLSDYDMNGDGVTNAQDADYLLEYLLGNETTLAKDGDVSGDGIVSSYDAHILLTKLNSNSTVDVPAYGNVTVNVRLALTAAGRQLLEDNYANGTYVEAYVYAESLTNEEGVTGTVHSIPVLAFYGNWTDPNMFDYSTYVELMYGMTNTVPYLYQQIGCGNALTINYGDGGEYYFGGNPYLDDDEYLVDRNAFNSQDASKLNSQYFTLIRNAAEMVATISNADTGEVYFQKAYGSVYPAYYFVNYGAWQNIQQGAYLGWTGKDASGTPLPEGTRVRVDLTAIPEYYRNDDGTLNLDNLGHGTTLTTQMVIDNTAPTASDMVLVDTTLTVTAKDNRYVAAAVLMNAAGTSFLAAATPNQTVLGQEVDVVLDLSMVQGKNFLLVVYDYANNATTYEITLDLPEIPRAYFTAIDYSTMDYVGVALDGTVTHMANTGLPLLARAAEYVGGYVFIITEDNSLCVANDEDLSSTYRICQLDPDSQLLITGFNDIAYNHADGKLYGQFYSQFNYEATPYLCTIDMNDGTIEVVCELPVDVNTMAIDTEGNFYSAGYNTNILYTYTLADVTAAEPIMTQVGEMGYYYSSYLTSMAWDHNTGKLYWAFPNTLLEINPVTAEVTLLGYHEELLAGLYTRPEEDEGMFDPVDRVDRVDLNLTDVRAILGNPLTLEATVWPWNASDRSVTWSSSDETVATVDANGTVTGTGLGTVTITAASNLDASKTASCTITVEDMPAKTLNGIVWDEDGYIWMSEFTTDNLPNYTKLTTESIDLDLASATIGQDGKIYAASLEVGTLKSSLYTLDPETFEPTLIGPSTDGYVDLAPAPGMPGNSLAAAFGGNVLFVDADNGDYYTWYNMFSYNVVAVAYVGTMELTDWGYNTLVDWYFIIDRVGYVYLLGFLEADGQYLYMEHDALAPGGIYTELGFEMETPYFGSAYFDGEYLYFSAYKESQNNVTLMAIDVAGGSKACYTLGTFSDNVWPVAGLMELDVTEVPDYMSLGINSRPKTAEENPELSSLKVAAVSDKIVSDGGLNSFVAPQSSGEYEEEKDQVTVKLTTANQLTGDPNGRMTVSYDSSKLTLVSVTGTTEAFAYTVKDGVVEIAFASADILAPNDTAATLVFDVLEPGEHTITVSHIESGNEPSGKQEFLTLECGEPELVDYVKWYSGSTSLNGTIDLNMYAILSDNLVNDPSSFVRFTFENRVVDVPMAEAVKSTMDDGTVRYRFSCELYAKQIADVAVVQFMKGDTPVGDAVSYSAMRYCVNKITKNDEPEIVDLCKAMLNYGAAAQLYFNYNTENLANASLSEAEKKLPDVDASAYKYSVTGSEAGIKAKSATLMLESEVKVRVYFTLTGSKTIDQYTFTIDGKVVTPKYNEKGWYVETDGIPAKDLDKMFEVKVGGITVSYGALSYVNSKHAVSNELEANLARALYYYFQEAEAYLG